MALPLNTWLIYTIGPFPLMKSTLQSRLFQRIAFTYLLHPHNTNSHQFALCFVFLSLPFSSSCLKIKVVIVFNKFQLIFVCTMCSLMPQNQVAILAYNPTKFGTDVSWVYRITATLTCPVRSIEHFPCGLSPSQRNFCRRKLRIPLH
jgi:hypothetical protein